MNLPAKLEYAAIAMLELANRYESGEPVRLRTIAETHGIPSPFLVQIMLQLKGAGLVESTRGSSGGYSLTRHPSEITLAELKQTIEGPVAELASSVGSRTSASRVLLETWKEIDAAEREMLARVTFADLADRCHARSGKMYYI